MFSLSARTLARNSGVASSHVSSTGVRASSVKKLSGGVLQHTICTGRSLLNNEESNGAQDNFRRFNSLALPILPAPSHAPRHQIQPQHPINYPLPESNLTVDSYFGINVFDRRTMKKYLSTHEFNHFTKTIENNNHIDYNTADSIANALLRWAQERGATHYTHWFQPITGTCAEKHDTFLDTLRDGETPISRFTGKQLIMGEPDGSSFPSGGLRMTHAARGYTAWDPHSPPFVLANSNGSTLYIPSCFFSWDSNKALDEKIPLLRSEAALTRESLKFFQTVGETKHNAVHMDAGLEQEFFLIDRSYYLQRPDLMLTGRTVLGAAPPKGQELEDQYFGPVAQRFLDCLHEFEVSCWKVGIPIQTRHKEVAPGQYEFAPKFAPANIGTDRNLLMMEILRRTARRHNIAVLFHEKPFKGVNGSGKHNNWSLGTNEKPSLLDPGSKPESNQLFLAFLAATIRAVDTHSDLMRVAISGVGNDHRLGANEAPPAIVSCYLGDDIELAVARYLAKDVGEKAKPDTSINLGIRTLPDLHRVMTDRNRTSTFAFTGNKFEFRAVGASQNPARSNTILNTIVADAIRGMTKEVAALKDKGVSAADALDQVTRNTLINHKRIIFNGNGYSKEWEIEAKKRGLPNLKTTPAALDTFYSTKNISLFESTNVFSKEELQARSNILFEDYTKRLLIEAKVLVNMVNTQVVPSGLNYQKSVAESIEALERITKSSGTTQRDLLNRIQANVSKLIEQSGQLNAALDKAHHQSSVAAGAHYCEANLIPLMNSIRSAADDLETLIPAKEWPLPTYHEMLFHQD